MEQFYSDQELLDALKIPDELAWKKYHDDRIRKLLSYGRGFFEGNLQQEDFARDNVSEAINKLYINIQNFDTIPQTEAYLFKIIKNRSLDQIEKLRIHQEKHEIIKKSLPLSEDKIFDNLAKAEVINAIYKIIGRNLGATTRKILILHYWDDLSVEEIAKLLNKSEDSIKGRKKRGIALIRDALKNLDNEILIIIIYAII